MRRRTERGIKQAEGCYVPPSGERPRKWTSWAQKPPLGRGPSPLVWDDRLDIPGQRRGLCGPDTEQ